MSKKISFLKQKCQNDHWELTSINTVLLTEKYYVSLTFAVLRDKDVIGGKLHKLQISLLPVNEI